MLTRKKNVGEEYVTRKEIELKWKDWWCSLRKKKLFLKAIGYPLSSGAR